MFTTLACEIPPERVVAVRVGHGEAVAPRGSFCATFRQTADRRSVMGRLPSSAPDGARTGGDTVTPRHSAPSPAAGATAGATLERCVIMLMHKYVHFVDKPFF